MKARARQAMPRGSEIVRARRELAECLRSRRQEIEEALLTRTYAIADPKEAADPEYADGLRAAVSVALDYSLAAIELGELEAPPPPPPVLLLAQARLAARNGVSLDAVLRRYFAGYTLLGDFLMQEAESNELLGNQELKRLLRAQADLFDRLVATISEEHVREGSWRLGSSDERRAESVSRLLNGELVDPSVLEYDVDAHHIGVIAVGGRAEEPIRALASALDCRPLTVRRDEDTIWAWLGARRPLEHELLNRVIRRDWPEEISLASGEPTEGLAGWRLTHRQAQAALTVGRRIGRRVVRYADVILPASILEDELLGTSLRQLYLTPLSEERDGGACLRETMRAYFASGRHVSSTAATLGTTRQTIAKRLKVVEERLGRSLVTYGAEMEIALRLEGLGLDEASIGK